LSRRRRVGESSKSLHKWVGPLLLNLGLFIFRIKIMENAYTAKLWFVFRQGQRKSINDQLWNIVGTYEEKNAAVDAYWDLVCEQKIIVEWSIIDGIKLAMGDFNQTEWFDYRYIGFHALPHADDIAWDVTIAVTHFLITGSKIGQHNDKS
jgi:hypothetical protein